MRDLPGRAHLNCVSSLSHNPPPDLPAVHHPSTTFTMSKVTKFEGLDSGEVCTGSASLTCTPHTRLSLLIFIHTVVWCRVVVALPVRRTHAGEVALLPRGLPKHCLFLPAFLELSSHSIAPFPPFLASFICTPFRPFLYKTERTCFCGPPLRRGAMELLAKPCPLAAQLN